MLVSPKKWICPSQRWTQGCDILIFRLIFRHSAWHECHSRTENSFILSLSPFITHQWYDCKHQPRLRSLFYHFSFWMMSPLVSFLSGELWWEEYSSSSIQSFKSVAACKTFILHRCKGEEASEQQMSWIFLFFPPSLECSLCEWISVITWWEQGQLGSHE